MIKLEHNIINNDYSVIFTDIYKNKIIYLVESLLEKTKKINNNELSNKNNFQFIHQKIEKELILDIEISNLNRFSFIHQALPIPEPEIIPCVNCQDKNLNESKINIISEIESFTILNINNKNNDLINSMKKNFSPKYITIEDKIDFLAPMSTKNMSSSISIKKIDFSITNYEFIYECVPKIVKKTNKKYTMDNFYINFIHIPHKKKTNDMEIQTKINKVNIFFYLKFLYSLTLIRFLH